MINPSHSYSFRNHTLWEGERLAPTPNAKGVEGIALCEDFEIILPTAKSRLMKYYAHDLFEFLSDSFGLCLRVCFTDGYAEKLKSPHKKIILLTESDAPELSVKSEQKGAFYIEVSEDSVIIVGKSERGTAQGVYYIEDCMRLYGEAKIKLERAEHAPIFSPRMTHSGYELDTFSDTFLAECAHAGMDSIIVFSGELDTNFHGFPDDKALWAGTGKGYCDFNNLIWRAEGYGLDVYLYSGFICDMHPDDEGAREYYDERFGELFRRYPALKGIIFVGECFEFPSKDPHTTGIRNQLKTKGDKRPSPGWYPCEDYPQFVGMIRDIIKEQKPDADIVFWSYNWGWAPEEARLRLIENLPRDISLLVTFEMWEMLKDDYGSEYKIADYSLSFVGPGKVFVSEAEKARECGIRLYAMGNSGGRTWDTGVAPYVPAPQQWQKRAEALASAHEEYGLAGLMENHHFGWMPSHLDLLIKNAFTTNTIPNSEMLTAIAKRDFGEAYSEALAAWESFSTGVTRLIPCDLDQYGPYRCGVTYPLIFTQSLDEIKVPHVEWSWHEGGGIWNPIYNDGVFGDVDGSLMRLRHIREVVKYFDNGVKILDTLVKKMNFAYGGRQSRQLAVARFILCSYVTAMHVMEWNIAKRLLFKLKEGERPERTEDLMRAIGIKEYSKATLGDYMKSLADKENENVRIALSSWEEDSSLGFEASMEYAFSDVFAEWKAKETEKSLSLLENFLNDIKD